MVMSKRPRIVRTYQDPETDLDRRLREKRKEFEATLVREGSDPSRVVADRIRITRMALLCHGMSEKIVKAI